MMNYTFIILLVFTIVCFVSCSYSENIAYLDKPYKDISMSQIGEQSYKKIKKQLIDDFDDYRNIMDHDFDINVRIVPILCFNRNKNKYVSALTKATKGQASLSWILGFKYNDSWKYFRRKASIAIFNEQFGYAKEDTMPAQALEYLAKKYILSEYLKKSKRTGEYEINDAYFEGLFDGYGWWETGEYKKLDDDHPDKPKRDSILLEKYMKQVKKRKSEMEKLKAEKESKKNNLDEQLPR